MQNDLTHGLKAWLEQLQVACRQDYLMALQVIKLFYFERTVLVGCLWCSRDYLTLQSEIVIFTVSRFNEKQNWESIFSVQQCWINLSMFQRFEIPDFRWHHPKDIRYCARFLEQLNFYLPPKAIPPRITVSSPIEIDEGEDLAFAKSPIFRHSSSLNSAIVEKYFSPISSPPMK